MKFSNFIYVGIIILLRNAEAQEKNDDPKALGILLGGIEQEINGLEERAKGREPTPTVETVPPKNDKDDLEELEKKIEELNAKYETANMNAREKVNDLRSESQDKEAVEIENHWVMIELLLENAEKMIEKLKKEKKEEENSKTPTDATMKMEENDMKEDPAATAKMPENEEDMTPPKMNVTEKQTETERPAGPPVDAELIPDDLIPMPEMGKEKESNDTKDTKPEAEEKTPQPATPKAEEEPAATRPAPSLMDMDIGQFFTNLLGKIANFKIKILEAIKRKINYFASLKRSFLNMLKIPKREAAVPK